MTKQQKNSGLKVVAGLVLITFITTQISWAGEGAALQNPDVRSQMPEKAVQEPSSDSSLPADALVMGETSQDFLGEETPLSNAGPETNDVLSTKYDVQDSQYAVRSTLYEYERYTFEEAIEQLRPEYATAIIVKSITQENIESLLSLPFEVGIIALKGEIVLFSTGNEEEIGILTASKKLLEQADFISHTHVSAEDQNGPSLFDLNYAVESSDGEYVVTRNGVFNYNRLGLLNGRNTYSFDDYVDQINDALDQSEEKDSIEARMLLNEFIRQMDLYNEATEDEKDAFRLSGEGISYFLDDFNRTVIGSDWTVIKGNWTMQNNELYHRAPGTNDGAVVFNPILNSSDYELQASFFYNATGTSYRGFIVRYQDSQNYYYAAYSRNGAYKIVKVVNGVDQPPLLQASSTGFSSNTYHTIKVRVEGTRIDIYRDGVYVDGINDSTYSTGKVGLYSGVYYNSIDNFEVTALGTPQPPAVPVVNTVPTYTNSSNLALSGTKPANTSIWINGVERYASDSGTTWVVNEPLSGEGLHNFSIIAKDAQGISSQTVQVGTTLDLTAPVGSIVLNAGSDFTNQLNLTAALTASDAESNIDKVRYSTDGGVNYSGWENYSATKPLTISSGDGLKEIRYQIRDLAGNISTYSDSITLDTVLPDIQVVSPATSSQANYSLVYRVDGGSPITQAVTLNSGANTLPINATDAAGNVRNTSFVVTYTSLTDGQITFFDYFNSPTLGADWTQAKGTWQIAYDQALQQGDLFMQKGEGSGCSKSNPGMLVQANPPASNDYKVEADFKFSNPEGSRQRGVIARYVDANNYYYGQYSIAEGKYRIIKVVNGNATALAEANAPVVAADSTHELVLSVRGSSLELFFDGQSVAQAQDFELQSGKTGIYTQTTVDLIDNFQVTTYTEAPRVTSAFYVNTTAYTLSGTKQAGASVWINGVERVSADSNTTWSYPVTLSADGNYNYAIQGKYSDGSESSVMNVTIMLDRVLPTGSMTINGNATYVNTTTVTLNLSGSDASSGVGQMRFMPAGGSWSAWENYSATKSYTLPSGNGSKQVTVQFKDRAGNISTGTISDTIQLDMISPSGSIQINNGAVSTNSANVTLTLSASDSSGISQMRFSTNSGQGWSEWEPFAGTKALTLPSEGGAREVQYQVKDTAGNTATYSDSIVYNPILSDGTQLIYQGSVLGEEITPDSHHVFYHPNGSVNEFGYPDGSKIVYLQDSSNVIQIYDNQSVLIEPITNPEVPALDEANALRLTLEGGLEAYYVEGELQEIRTQTGIRITNFTLNENNEIQNALFVYPDGSKEIIRKGVVLRRIGADGTILDLTPKGFAVREILADGNVQYFSFNKTSQTTVSSTKIFTVAGAFSSYDDKGILREVSDSAAGKHYVYTRTDGVNEISTSLAANQSTVPEAKTLKAGKYSLTGVLIELTLQDNSRITFENGKIKNVFNAQGQEEADYAYLGDGVIDNLLRVSRGSDVFTYDETGFLTSVETTAGTIHRVAEDLDGDGLLTDEQIVELLLETAGGDKLSDFELDSEGRIISGIIETKEGIKQFIENYVMTGFETVDGKVYDFANNEAILKEWNFRDGTKITYGGGNITEILFPDNSRLHTIGFDSEKKVTSFVEEANGKTKYFENGKLVRLVTGENTQIFYGGDGLAQRIIFSDLSEETVSYSRNESGEMTEITFFGNNTYRTFTPEGALVNLLTQGVGAEITNNEVSKLFTRFGEIENPQFSETGIMSGTIDFVDGTKQILENGLLIQTIRSSGTKVNYVNGRIDSLETDLGRYKILYTETNGTLTSAKLKLEFMTDQPEIDLVSYLLDPTIIPMISDAAKLHASELAQILFSKPLYNSLDNQHQIQSQLSTGDTLFFAKLAPDSERGNVYEFNARFMPELTNITGSQGYISFANGLDLAATLIDMNGDGFLDRVYTDNASSNYWWVQFNAGGVFTDPVQWIGVENSGLIRQSDGGQPFIFLDLVDINGDNKPDRILKKLGNEQEWFVQINNGSGFETSVKWQGSVQILPNGISSANYAVRVYDAHKGLWEIQELIADLIDLDGDGLMDRVLRPNVPPYDHWFFQKNLGDGFADAVLWEGVDTTFASDAGMGGSLFWYDTWMSVRNIESIPSDLFNAWVSYIFSFCSGFLCSNNGQGFANARALGDRAMYDMIAAQSILIDMNGDGLVDRVLLQNKNPNDPNSAMDWYVQLNNGSGFDSAILWAENVRNVPNAYALIKGQTRPTGSTYYPLPGAGDISIGYNSGKLGTSIRVVNGWQFPSTILIDLCDVTGDGLPDRVTVDRISQGESINAVWWVEVNNGHGFDVPVQWQGIFGENELETSIGQNIDIYKNWPVVANLKVKNVFKDINGDNIPDRLIFRSNENRWLVQYGTGSGFLPVEEMEIQGLQAPAATINSSRYDYLHVSLRSDQSVPTTEGRVKVTLSDPNNSETMQEWFIDENLTGAWQDFFLTIDHEKPNATEVKIEFEAVDPNAVAPAIYADNVTFTATRPSATKDWLDRLLAEEEILAEVYSDRNQTLAQYLGLSEASSAIDFDWEKLLTVETRIQFDPQGEAQEFETFYGTVSQIENGRVVESLLPNGNHVQFEIPDPENPNQVTQTIINGTDPAQTVSLSYGRVRSVSRSNQAALQYSYEFDLLGNEITVVHDPDSNITERYMENKLISRTVASGVVTSFFYDTKSEIIRSEISYKGRVYDVFEHGISKSGNKTVTTADGITEEYGSNGVIRYHTTPEGYGYEHSFEQPRKLIEEDVIESVTLLDGTTFEMTYRKVTESEEIDAEAPEVHLVRLVSYDDPSGEQAKYEDGILKSLKLTDKTKIEFNRIHIEETIDPETNQLETSITVQDVLVFHPDGTITEFKNGMPFSVTKATGQKVDIQTEGGLLINANESASFHFGEAQKLWNELVLPKWNDFELEGTLAIESEYTKEDGKILSRRYAEGTVELYGDPGTALAGKIQQILGRDGERLVSYEYDSEGNPTAIHMEGSRRRLDSAVVKMRAEVAMQREEALSLVAERDQVLNQTIEGQYQVAKEKLLAIRSQLESQRNQVASISVRGKQAKSMIGDALAQLQAGIDQVNQALVDLATQRTNALDRLQTQVQEAKTQIETETNNAYTEIETEKQKVRKEILKQEISPLVYHWYRKILGRDPNTTEYESWITTANYEAGAWDLQGLKSDLQNRQELTDRTLEVQAIKTRVQTEIQNYLGMSESAKLSYAQSLGILPEELISLSSSEANSIITWLNGRSLHFGQSAYLALEAMLKASGYTPQASDFPGCSLEPAACSRLNLASKLILIDVLTGTLTPFEREDLVLSLYAMKKVGESYGLDTTNYQMTYDTLKAIYDEACSASPDTCNFRLIAHINGNHYVVITKITDTEVTYTDPGAGPESSLEIVTITKEEFLQVWVNPKDPQSGFGYVMSSRAPPATVLSSQYSALTTQQEMQVRGAFFLVLIFAVVSIVSAIANAIAATVTAIVTLIATVIQGIATILTGFGQIFGSLFTGSLFEGIKAGFATIWHGLGIIGKAFVGAFNAFHGALLGGIQGIAEAIPIFGATLSSWVGTSAFAAALKFSLIGLAFDGALQLLDVIGLSPKISQSLISGGKAILGIGLLATGNPVGLAFLGSGTSELLNLHTTLSPTITNIIGIGTSALGAFATGGLMDALPYLAMDFASAGVVGIGNLVGLDPRIASLISIPVAAVASGFTTGLINGGGASSILGAINQSLFSSATLGGLIAVGANVGLSAIGAPPVLSSFIPSLISGLVNGAGSSSGGSQTGQSSGDSIFKRITEGIAKFGSGLINGAQSVISFGQKVLEGFGAVTREGFAKAVDFFSSAFDRGAQEKLYQLGGGCIECAVSDLAVIQGDRASFSFGDLDIEWNQSGEGILSVIEGGRSYEFQDLSVNTQGSFFGQIAYADEIEDGINVYFNLSDSYEEIKINYGGIDLLNIKGDDILDRYGNFLGGNIEFPLYETSFQISDGKLLKYELLADLNIDLNINYSTLTNQQLQLMADQIVNDMGVSSNITDSGQRDSFARKSYNALVFLDNFNKYFVASPEDSLDSLIRDTRDLAKEQMQQLIDEGHFNEFERKAFEIQEAVVSFFKFFQQPSSDATSTLIRDLKKQTLARLKQLADETATS